MNCFIRAAKWVWNMTEDELKQLCVNEGIKYEVLEQIGMQFEKAYVICHKQGMLFFDNLDLRDTIWADNKMFDKGKYIFIYGNHAVGSVDRIYTDPIAFEHREMRGWFYYPHVGPLVHQEYLDEAHFYKASKNRIIFKIHDNMVAKVAITEAGYCENLFDLYHRYDDNYARCYEGDERVIFQEFLKPDDSAKHLKFMQKLAHNNGYDLCQYGIDVNGVPKFYDGKWSYKNKCDIKLDFMPEEMPLVYKWMDEGCKDIFMNWYWRNA